LATGELVKLLDLGACDLGEMSDPVTAAAADYDTVLKTQLALVSVRLLLQNMLWAESDSRKERKLQRQLDDTKATGFMLSSILSAMRAQ
jgi:hypothetical protein